MIRARDWARAGLWGDEAEVFSEALLGAFLPTLVGVLVVRIVRKGTCGGGGADGRRRLRGGRQEAAAVLVCGGWGCVVAQEVA